MYTFKGTVMQIETELMNDPLRVLKFQLFLILQ